MDTIYTFPGTIKKVNYDSASDRYSFVIARDNGGPDFTVPEGQTADYSEGDRVECKEIYRNTIVILRKV